MIKKLSLLYVNWLIKNGADEKKRQVYMYGMEGFLSEVISNVLLFSIAALILNMVVAAIFWSLGFLFCRVIFGGFHAKTHFKCILISTIYGALCLFILKTFIFPLPLIVAGIIFSIVISLTIVPVTHPNRPLSETRQKFFQKIAPIITLSESSIILILYFCHIQSISGYVFLGMFSAAMLSLAGKLSQKFISQPLNKET